MASQGACLLFWKPTDRTGLSGGWAGLVSWTDYRQGCSWVGAGAVKGVTAQAPATRRALSWGADKGQGASVSGHIRELMGPGGVSVAGRAEGRRCRWRQSLGGCYCGRAAESGDDRAVGALLSPHAAYHLHVGFCMRCLLWGPVRSFRVSPSSPVHKQQVHVPSG